MNCSCEDIIIEVPVEEVIIEMTPEGTDGLDGNGIEYIEKLSETAEAAVYRIHYTDGGHFDYTVYNGKDGGSEWGMITGDLADQADLQAALDLKANAADLGALASKDAVNYQTEVTNKPVLGALAALDSIDYTSNKLTNKPTLGDLAGKNSVDYSSGEVTNKPTLGDLAALNSIDYTSNKLTNKPALGTLAGKNSVSYDTEVTDKPTLGTMASKNDAPSDDKTYGRKNGAWAEVTGGGSSEWGQISGTLSDQTDLQSALDEKADIIHVSASGAVVSISDGAAYPVDSLSVAVNPVQDLHGQPYPYPAGGGINLALVNADHITSQQNCTYTFKNNGFEAVSTANYGRVGFTWPVTEGETYTISYTASHANGSSQYPRLIYSTEDATWSTTGTGYLSHQTFTTTPTRYSYTFTATSSGIIFIGAYIGSSSYGATIFVKDFMIEKGSTASPFAPYENICPISTRSQANIYHEDEYDADADPALTVAFGQAIFGGSLNVLTGLLTVDGAEIASYAGETLPGAWISDRDAYVPGETPTIGAQVVYKVANPTTVQLTAGQMSLTYGNNAVWADCGASSLGYRADTKLYIDRKIAAAVASLQALILENN